MPALTLYGGACQANETIIGDSRWVKSRIRARHVELAGTIRRWRVDKADGSEIDECSQGDCWQCVWW